MTWYPLANVGDSLFQRAPIMTTVEISTPGGAEHVWSALAAEDAAVSWSSLVTGSDWQTPPGLGATRKVQLGRVLTLHEVFYRWDVNARMTFRADAVSLPGIEAFGEDYVLSDRPNGGTTLRWTVAVIPKHGGAALGAPAGVLLNAAIGNLAAGLRRRVRQNQISESR